MSIFEKEEKPKNISGSRLLAGFFDISIILALKTISDVVGNNFGYIVLGYYFLCYARFNTTIGGTLMNLKIVKMNEENDHIDFKYGMLRSAVISLIIFLVYYFFTNEEEILQYVIPAVLILIVIVPIFLNKQYLTIHDVLSRTKVVVKKHRDKSLIKESILVIFASFAIITLIGMNNYYMQFKCEDLVENKDYASVTSKCKMATRISQDKDQYYQLGVAFLKQKQYSQSIKYLKKANKMGNKEAGIVIIESYALNDDYKNAEEQAIENIKDLSSSLILSRSLINKYKISRNKNDLYVAYVYLYIYNKLYNKITLQKSILTKKGQQELLEKYYTTSKNYMSIARGILSTNDIKEAEEEGDSIISQS